jgi:hypothetical protein
MMHRYVWKGPYFEPRDLWIGVYWRYERLSTIWRLDVYVCLVPCFPVRMTWRGLAR